jgi:hypothetical protein
MRTICGANIATEQRVTKAVLAGGIFFGLLILFVVPPTDLPVPACAFHAITGHSCLTCGMTRSLHAVLRGELAAAIRYHLFGPVVFLGMLLCLVIFSSEAVRGRKLVICAGAKIRNRTLGMFAVAWLVYWGIRLVAECTGRFGTGLTF